MPHGVDDAGVGEDRSQRGLQRSVVGDIDLDQLESAGGRSLLEVLKPSAGQIVDANDSITETKQGIDQMAADEARRSGDDHGRRGHSTNLPLVPRCRSRTGRSWEN